MSQQRQCCCGEEQGFGHECLATDKIFPYGVNSNRPETAQQKGDYKFLPHNLAGVEESVQGFYNSRKGFGAPNVTRGRFPTNFMAVENDPSFNDVKTRENENTTGMGCMLQHGTLIMSTRLLSTQARTFSTYYGSCPAEGNCAGTNFHFGSDVSGFFLPAEQEQFIMYNAYKDYWYLEVGPRGFPFSYRASREPLVYTKYSQGNYYTEKGLGVRSSGSEDIGWIGNCDLFPEIPPVTTDADLMCYPTLTNFTNPANVYFTDDAGGGGTNVSGAVNAIENAYATWQAGVDNNTPELANHQTDEIPPYTNTTGNWLCTYMESNTNPWAALYGSNRRPCGGSFMPGVSSWQAYICRSQAEYRLLGDTMSFGNGAPVFTSPSSILDLKQNPNPSGLDYAPLQNAMLGTLYRVRLWVRSDQVTINDRFPCNDVNGETQAYYPPETNQKMRRSISSGGYSVTKKLCASGPSSLMYACSGVPIFSSDFEMMREMGDAGDSGDSTGIIDRLTEFYYGDWPVENPSGYGGVYDLAKAKCVFNVDQVENGLGETGLYAAKDWRQDQLNKWDTMTSEFRTIAEQNKTNPDLTEEQRIALESYASEEFTGVPSIIKDRIAPSGDIELLPAQKFGEQMLTAFITRARPKQLLEDEPGDTLLSEMAYYQATQFDGTNFAIDYIDPWHPENDGGLWKPLGRDRVDVFNNNIPISFKLNNPGGDERDVPVYYPIRSMFNSWRASRGLPDFTDEEFDVIVPDWEQKLFKAWWMNNPLYFHAAPGGWAWAGDGLSNTMAKDSAGVYNISECRWSSQLKNLSNLGSVSQLEWYNTNRGKLFCPGGGGETWPCNLFKMDSPGGGGALISTAMQLRNRPGQPRCSPLSPSCFLFANDGTQPYECGGICDCFSTTRCGGWNPGGALCADEGACVGQREKDGYIIYNCCEVFNSYAGTNRSGRKFKATATIHDENPTSIDTENTKSDVYKNWNLNNPEMSFKDGSLYGSRCTEQGNCPPGYQCCCAGGCGGNCFCVPSGINCDTLPCSSSNNFKGDCCTTFGSCCYEDEDGLIRCEDDVTKEKCIARKEHGGLNGTFTKDTLCDEFPCRTDGVTGACFYVDPLLDHQICRETTSQTCTDLNGEFFANQVCEDISGKITTGYETKTNSVGTKPSEAGDKSCGQFGFSVNCCTKTTDPDTGEDIYTYETKCMSDCDHGKGGSARIVQTREACGELGHCCTMNGFCEPNVTRESCTGTWLPGAECDERSCAIPLEENYYDTNRFGGMPGRRPYEAGHLDIEDRDPLKYSLPYTPPSGKIPAYDPEIDRPAPPPSGNGKRIKFGHTPGKPGEAQSALYRVGGPAARIGDEPDPDPEEDEDGDDDFGGDCNDVCSTPEPGIIADICLPSVRYFRTLATEWRPYLPTEANDPGYCNVRPNTQASRSCIIRQVQAVRTGFRYAIFAARQDSDGVMSKCPNSITSFNCCKYRCNPNLYAQSQLICDGGSDDPLGDWTLHRSIGTYVSHVYPFRIRCQQRRDEAGLYRCALLSQEIAVPEADRAEGIIGASDVLTCHYVQIRLADAESSEYSCQTIGRGCDGTDCGNDSTFDQYTEWSCQSDCVQAGFRAYENHVNPGGACIGIRSGTVTARSIPFPGDTVAPQYLYAPADGISGIPLFNCPSRKVTRNLDSIPGTLPMGTLGRCAEFYSDKLLSDFEDEGFPEQDPPNPYLTFHDYGGLLGTYEDNRTEPPTQVPLPSGKFTDGDATTQIQSEFVDANWNGDQNDPTFWLKQEFPGLRAIRLFSAGCFRVPGSFHGGQSETIILDEGLSTEQVVGGGYAGTLVVIFGSTEEFQKYDEYYGSENLKLSFQSAPPGYENVGGDDPEINPRITDDEVYFVGRPSYNLRNVDNSGSDDGPGAGVGGGGPDGFDMSYESVGYLQGFGLTFADVNNGEVGDAVGKVYEFCVPFGKGTAHVGQLKPIFTPGETIPAFSGLRGPIALFGQNTDDNGGRFFTKLERFTQKVITNETLGTCIRTWVGTDPPAGCNGGDDDDGGTDPPGSGAPGGDNGFFGGGCVYDDIWGSEDNAYEGSETFEVPDNASNFDYCFFDGSTLEDRIIVGENSEGDPIYETVWDRAWFPSLAGITDGGAVGCCNQDNDNGFDCILGSDGGGNPIYWAIGDAGQNAGNNVFRRANTSNDCREDLA